ncbi:MAG: response regulator [Bacteriovorax sp.]|nr:response regulator [Bacteriovorax sp.]
MKKLLTIFPDTSTNIDQNAFNRSLKLSVSMPLVLMSILTVIFIGLIFQLISAVNSVDHVNHVVAQAYETQNIIIDSETGMRGFLLTGKDEFLEPYIKSEKSLPLKIKILTEWSKTYSEQTQRLSLINAEYRQWKVFAKNNIELKRQNDKEYLNLVSSGNGKILIDEIRAQFIDFIRFEERLLAIRSETTQKTIQATLLIIVLISGLAAVFLALYSRKQLKTLSGSFGSALQSQAELNHSLLQEAWLRTGISKLYDLSRGDIALTELSTKILNHIVHYTGAQIGAFYVISDEDELLHRISTYAFSSEAEAKQSSFKLNEGLVGQAAAENRLLHITDLPENYIQINSSLGTAPPKTLLVTPALVEGSVKAVIELGFLNEPDPQVIELLERVSLGIALTIRSWQYRMKVQNLLSEAHTQNEELQEQQEELKAANEELEEQSRAIQDSQAELEQTNEQLELQTHELEKRSDEVQRASQYKSEFLANMSHELRTPLNSTLILAKLLADNPNGNLNKDQIQYAKSIYSAGNDLHNLINDILDLSKVEAGMLEICPENVFISSVLRNLENTFIPVADDKKLKFLIKIDPEIADSMITDRHRLEQILKNLLSNAFKFTEKGLVTLHISRSHNERLSLSVIDTGIGVPKEQQKVIFEAFRQADGTTNRKYGGTGLGLSISQDLAKLLGGIIEVESTPGEGSRFTLILPMNYSGKEIALVPIRPAKIESRIIQLIKRVLIVEDDKIQRESMVQLIADPDFEITAVALASEALDALKKSVFDCIVIDLKLPDMSGDLLLKKMSEQQELGSLPPVIVYTGRSLSRDEEDQLRKYSRSIIIKGARSPERLLDEVKLFLNSVESNHSIKKPETQNPIKCREELFVGRKVLIVDDDIRNIFALTAALEQKGAIITVARNGMEALTRLEEDPLMDLVLMDIMMPEMDGFQATREIRKQKRFASLPIIAVTAKATKSDQLQCMQAGANDYLAKPIDLQQLFSLSRVWMPKPGRE